LKLEKESLPCSLLRAGYNVLSGRGSPAHLHPALRKAREDGFNATSPGQSPLWPRPPPTGIGETYVPRGTPRGLGSYSQSEASLRSTGQLPPAAVPAKSYFRSTSPAPSLKGPPSLKGSSGLASRNFSSVALLEQPRARG